MSPVAFSGPIGQSVKRLVSKWTICKFTVILNPYFPLLLEDVVADLKKSYAKSAVTTSKSRRVPPSFVSLHRDSKILQSHNRKYVNEECLVVAVGTRDDVTLLCAPMFTTGAHDTAIFKVLYYGQDIDTMLAKLF